MNFDTPDRRTVLKGIGIGIAGSGAYAGVAGAHGNDEPRFPSWFETDIWEMTAKLHGPADEESHAPFWHIAPGAAEKTCPQLVFPFTDEDGTNVMTKFVPELEDSDKWDLVAFDQTAAAFPFSTMWHIHWVFGGTPSGANGGWLPRDLVNEAAIDLDGDGDTDDTVGGVEEDHVPLTSGSRIRAAIGAGEITIVETPFFFNCPLRPAKGDEHVNYCD